MSSYKLILGFSSSSSGISHFSKGSCILWEDNDHLDNKCLIVMGTSLLLGLLSEQNYETAV